jgi:hypothetical protein
MMNCSDKASDNMLYYVKNDLLRVFQVKNAVAIVESSYTPQEIKERMNNV